MKLYSLLKNNSYFRNLFIAGLIDQFGTWFHSTCLMMILIKVSGSAGYVSYSLLALALPALLFSNKIGRYVDKENLIKVMFVSNLINAVLAAFYVIAYKSIFSIIILNCIVSVFHLVFSTSRGKFIGGLLDDKQRQTANGAMGIVVAIMAILGASVGGIFVSLFSIEAAFWTNVFTFLISAIFIFRIPNELGNSETAVDVSTGEETIKESFFDTLKLVWSLDFVPKNILYQFRLIL